MSDPDDREPRSPDGQPPEDGQPEDPTQGVDENAGQNLWRLLQEDGQIASEAKSYVDPPRTSQPLPQKDGQRSAAEELEQWRRERDPDQDDSRASRLRQMIDAPEQLEEGFEFDNGRAREANNGDFDAAVSNYYGDMRAAIACRLHPEVDSVAQCPECQAFYCQDCLVVRKGRMLCRECAETTFTASEEEVLRAQEQGLDEPDVGVLPDQPPEFQLGSFGIEGAPASPLKTLLAWMIDFALVRAVLVIAVWLAAQSGSHWVPMNVRELLLPGYEGDPVMKAMAMQAMTFSPIAFWLPLSVAADFVYYFITLGFFNRSVGMSWTGCRIISEWGDFAGFATVALRTLVFIGCLELPAVLLSFVLGHFRGPHDLAAGTYVINYSGNKRVDAYDNVQIRL